MNKIKLMLIASFSLLLTGNANAQTHMRTYVDATTGIAGFSYDISISYKLIKGWSKARPSEVYSVKLVHVVPSSRGFFLKDSKKQFYSCAELGNSCNPNNWQDVAVVLTGHCKSASKDRITFSRINEEHTIEHWVEENGSCNFDGLEANVRHPNSVNLVKIIRDKEYSTTTSSSGSTGSSNSSSGSSSGYSETKKTETNTTPGQIPDSYTGNPLHYNKTIPSASTDKFTQNVEAVGELINAAAPLLEQWGNNLQKKRDAEQKRAEEEADRKKGTAEWYFKTQLDKYGKAAENGDEDARMRLISADYSALTGYGQSNFAYLVPNWKEWLFKASDNKNLDAMNILGHTSTHSSSIFGITREAAIQLLENSANLNSIDAMRVLANYYDHNNDKKCAKYGQSGGNDQEKAFYWLTKAAENGSLAAMRTLSHIYTTRSTGYRGEPCLVKYNVKINKETASYWLSKSKNTPDEIETYFKNIFTDFR